MSSVILICLATSITATLLLVPIVRRLAHALGIVDRPDQHRKLHRESIALGGGVAVFAATVLAVVAAAAYDQLVGDAALPILSKWYRAFLSGRRHACHRFG